VEWEAAAVGDAARYGDEFADVYDRWYGSDGDTDDAVALLASLAAGGPVLELGAGTGRIAIPLAERGLAVVGVDASPAMLERLAHKPGGELVSCVLADMTALDAGGDERTRGPFAVIVIARNTIFNVADAAAGRRCMAGAASRLAPGGALVIEADVPNRTAPAEGREVRPRPGGGEVVISWRHDRHVQKVSGQTLDGRGRVRNWDVRYSPPEELDEWAVAAGLHLEQRWAGWSRTPARPGFARHVSVYRS
jgi:SAM-dependent methyltransferase